MEVELFHSDYDEKNWEHNGIFCMFWAHFYFLEHKNNDIYTILYNREYFAFIELLRARSRLGIYSKNRKRFHSCLKGNQFIDYYYTENIRRINDSVTGQNF